MISEICQLAVARLSEAFGAILLKNLRCLKFFWLFFELFSFSFFSYDQRDLPSGRAGCGSIIRGLWSLPCQVHWFPPRQFISLYEDHYVCFNGLDGFHGSIAVSLKSPSTDFNPDFFLISGFFYIKKLTLMSLTEKKVELFSPPPPYILLSVWMMMELFNDYGTFTYKILQTKTKNSPKNKTKNLGTQFAKLSWCRETLYPTYQATLHKYWPSCRNKSWQIPKIWWPWQGCC